MNITDLNRWRDLLDSCGIGCEQITEDNGQIYLKMVEGRNKISGYSGFFTLVEFSSDGEFITIGAYEE